MLPAVVLAAGASSRMRSAKALLPDPDGVPFVLRIVDTLAQSGLDDIVVVTGADHGRVAAALQASRWRSLVRLATNPRPERGQLSSLHTGMDVAVTPSVQALMVTLVDVPLVAPATVAAVIDAWTARGAAVVRPAVGDRHGHPVIFARRLFAELREAPLEAGAKHVLRMHEGEIENVPVHDSRCAVDVDTPEEYEQLLRGGRLRTRT